MSRELIGHELKKLFGLRALHLFVLLCIGFQLMMFMSGRDGAAYVSYVRQARQTAGERMGDGFSRQVSRLADCEEKERLMRETKGAVDIFEAYDPHKTARLLVDSCRMRGWVAKALERKYERQAARVHALAKADASLEVAAAGMTDTLFDMLFYRLCRGSLTSGLLTAVFAALYICGSEQMERTWQTVYATRRGRWIQREKLLAGLLYTAAAYSVTAVVSCVAFAYVWRLGDIWNADMATQFYTIRMMGMRLPFVPWADMTLREYLAATLALGGAVIVAFYLLGYAAALFLKNSLVAFAVLLTASALLLELSMLSGDSGSWGIYALSMWSPVMVWWSQPLWFSDMGINAVVPWQECMASGLCLLAAVALLRSGCWYFYRKDLR